MHLPSGLACCACRPRTNPGTWTYYVLDRMSASLMGTYTNDVLGNRQKGTGDWDGGVPMG